MKRSIVVVFVALAGCTIVAPVKTGRDTYMIEGGVGLVAPSPGMLIGRANEFCAEQNKEIVVVGTTPWVPGATPPSVRFSCTNNTGSPIPGRNVASGTCFAIDSPGLVATAHHIVEGATSITVRFSDDAQPRPAEIKAASRATDLAVLAIEVVPTPGSLSLINPGGARSGQEVFTVGYPVPELLGEEPKFTEGVISGMSGIQGEAAFMQISVPVQPGNSGGPVVREDGLVVGVVSSSAAAVPFIEATGSLPQDVNWAASAEYLRLLFDASGPPRKASSRAEAIEMARRAVCAVEVRR